MSLAIRNNLPCLYIKGSSSKAAEEDLYFYARAIFFPIFY
jgi:hypothetical protein